MPTINATPPAAPAAIRLQGAGQARATPDWDALLPELKAEICTWLNAGDRARLADVSPAWRETIVSKRSDLYARSIIASREGVHPDACPAPPAGHFAGLPGEMAAKGFVHAAMLFKVYATCEHLSSVSPDRAVYETLPGVGLAGSTVYLPQTGVPEFMVAPRHGDDFMLMSTNGTQRDPRPLRDMRLLDEPRLVVTNSMLTPGALDAAQVLQGRDGSLHLFDVSNDALQPLPDVFTIRDANTVLAAVSRDGRYVAATYTMPDDPDIHLRVHDHNANRTVTETTLRGTLSHSISVDSRGTVVVGGGRFRYEVEVGGDGQDVARTALPRDFIATQLSPDEGYILSRHVSNGVIRLENRQGGRCILLDPANQPAREVHPCSITFGLAMGTAAAQYDDGTLAVYDLLTADDRTDVLHPKLHLQLQGALQAHVRYFHPAATWFDRDGGGLHAAYPLSREHGYPDTGLMHLRFW